MPGSIRSTGRCGPPRRPLPPLVATSLHAHVLYCATYLQNASQLEPKRLYTSSLSSETSVMKTAAARGTIWRTVVERAVELLPV